MLYVTLLLPRGSFHTKHVMIAVNIVEVIKQTWTCLQMDRQTDGQTDGQGETNIPPNPPPTHPPPKKEKKKKCIMWGYEKQNMKLGDQVMYAIQSHKRFSKSIFQ